MGGRGLLAWTTALLVILHVLCTSRVAVHEWAPLQKRAALPDGTSSPKQGSDVLHEQHP